MPRVHRTSVLLVLPALMAVHDAVYSSVIVDVPEEHRTSPVLNYTLDDDDVFDGVPVSQRWSGEWEDVQVPFRRKRRKRIYNESQHHKKLLQRRIRQHQRDDVLLLSNATAIREQESSDNATSSPDDNENSDGSNTTETAAPKPYDNAGGEEPADPTPTAVGLELDTVERVVVDYASKSAGALILEKSGGWKGTSNLLNSNKDQYAIIPCQEKHKDVVIGLSEDILVKQMCVSNYERYSSHMQSFMLLGSQTLSNSAVETSNGRKSKWTELGTFTLQNMNGVQTFEIAPAWARYLKIRFLSHYGDEHFCTVSQISVSGSTMLQGFHEQFEQWDDDSNGEEELDSATASDILVDAAVASQGEGSSSEQMPDSEPTSSDGRRESSGDHTAVTPNAQCYTKLDAMCPRDLSFERSVFLFDTASATAATSPFEQMSVLSAASICTSSISSSDRASIPMPSMQLGVSAILSSQSTQSNDVAQDQRLLAQRFISGVGGRGGSKANTNDVLLTESPLVKQLQHLVQSQGADASLHQSIAQRSRNAHDADVKSMQKSGGGGAAAHIPDDKKDANATESSQADASTTQPLPPTVTVITTGVAPTEKKESSAQQVAALQETNEALATLLSRFPRAACLGKLNFAALKASRVKDRSQNAGNNGQPPPSNTMEPIFKKLTDEIKTLQASAAVHDQFAKEATACYQNVLLDLMVEHESTQIDLSQRLDRLELTMAGGLNWLAGFLRLLAGLFVVPLHVLTLLASVSLVQEQSGWWKYAELLAKMTACVTLWHLAKAYLRRQGYNFGRYLVRLRFKKKAGARDKLMPNDDCKDGSSVAHSVRVVNGDTPQVDGKPMTNAACKDGTIVAHSTPIANGSALQVDDKPMANDAGKDSLIVAHSIPDVNRNCPQMDNKPMTNDACKNCLTVAHSNPLVNSDAPQDDRHGNVSIRSVTPVPFTGADPSR